MNNDKFKRPTKDSLKRARATIDKLRTPIVPSDELVRIVHEITKITNPDDAPAVPKDKVAARPDSDIHQ